VTRAAATGGLHQPPLLANGAPSPAAAGGKAGILKGAIHGDLLVRGQDGSTHTVTFDRGKISSLSASSITIQRPDGVAVSDDLTDQTVFNGTPRDQLTSGTPVIVVSDGHTATHVVSRGAGAQAAAKACAAAPADGSAAAGNGNGLGQGLRARIKERLCQRLEQRQQRRAGKGAAAGQGGPGGSSGQGGVAGQGPAAGPSSMVDDGLKTIVS
jgi:hypothetical protein